MQRNCSPAVNAMQAPSDRAARRGVLGPARSRGVHLPRRGERAPAAALVLPQDGRGPAGVGAHA